MTDYLYYVFTFLIAMNLIAFFVMLLDKARSERDSTKRIPEGALFFIAAMFGSLGIYAGMFAFRHKIRKWYFVVGIPMLAIENIASLYLVYANI